MHGWLVGYIPKYSAKLIANSEILYPPAVLCISADGDYIITMMTKATIKYDGTVEWEPPAIFKSQCDIDVEFFPFDVQQCKMKFGVWTYHGYLVTHTDVYFVI